MKPDIKTLIEKSSQNRDFLDRIGQKIPGYKGYVEEAELYNADRVIREQLALSLKGFKDELFFIANQAYEANETEVLKPIEKVALFLEKLFKRISSAEFKPPTSKGDATVTEDKLKDILEHDWRLFEDIDKMEQYFDTMLDEENNKEEKLAFIYDALLKLEKNFETRKDIIWEVF